MTSQFLPSMLFVLSIPPILSSGPTGPFFMVLLSILVQLHGCLLLFFYFYLHLHLASVSGDHVRYHMHTVPVTHVNGVPGRVSCLLHFKLPFLFLSNETFTSPSIVFWSSFCSLISYSTFYFLLIGGFRARCIHSLAVSFACWRLRLQGSSSHSYTYSCS